MQSTAIIFYPKMPGNMRFDTRLDFAYKKTPQYFRFFLNFGYIKKTGTKNVYMTELYSVTIRMWKYSELMMSQQY